MIELLRAFLQRNERGIFNFYNRRIHACDCLRSLSCVCRWFWTGQAAEPYNDLPTIPTKIFAGANATPYYLMIDRRDCTDRIVHCPALNTKDRQF